MQQQQQDATETARQAAELLRRQVRWCIHERVIGDAVGEGVALTRLIGEGAGKLWSVGEWSLLR